MRNPATPYALAGFLLGTIGGSSVSAALTRSACKTVNVIFNGPTIHTLICQGEFPAVARGTDSGAPVFIIKSGSDVSLAGIIWGGSEVRTLFSQFVYVGHVLTKQDRRIHCPGGNCWLSVTASKQ